MSSVSFSSDAFPVDDCLLKPLIGTTMAGLLLFFLFKVVDSDDDAVVSGRFLNQLEKKFANSIVLSFW
jgi:hypothetical protein